MVLKLFKSPLLNERGAALLQVVFVGALLAITAYLFAQFFTHADNEGMRIIRRNQNLNTAMDFSDFTNDRTQVKSTANIVSKDPLGNDILYP